MNIILIAERDGYAQRRTFTLNQVIMGIASLFLVVPLVLGGMAFWVSRSIHPADRLPGRDAQVAQTTAEVQSLRALSHSDLAQLATRVGQLAAKTSRLDLLGARLSALAGLSGNALKGQNLPVTSSSWVGSTGTQTVTSIRTLTDGLRQALADQQVELASLAAVLAARQVTALTTPHGWPVRGGWISSPFGPRPDPFTGRPGFHPGVDIAAPVGTPVRAMAAGVVIFAGLNGGWGRLVKVYDGHSEVTMYAHLSARYVHVGQVITRGTLLGRVGDTGLSTGPHLHFEVLLHNQPINPIGFLDLADRR